MLCLLLLWLGMFVGDVLSQEPCPAGKTRDGCEERGLTRDGIGCCAKPKKVKPRRKTYGKWGKRKGSGGCKSGLVVEDGYCCWSGQAFVDGKCIGEPECPSGLVISGERCVEPGCPSGKVKVKVMDIFESESLE